MATTVTGRCFWRSVQKWNEVFEVPLSSGMSWFMVTWLLLTLVLLHRLLSGPSVWDGTSHSALCRGFSRTAGRRDSGVLPGRLHPLLSATAAATAATAADWVAAALLSVPAALRCLQDTGRFLLLRLIHVAGLLIRGAQHLPVSLWPGAHLSVGAAGRLYRQEDKNRSL